MGRLNSGLCAVPRHFLDGIQTLYVHNVDHCFFEVYRLTYNIYTYRPIQIQLHTTSQAPDATFIFLRVYQQLPVT